MPQIMSKTASLSNGQQNPASDTPNEVTEPPSTPHHDCEATIDIADNPVGHPPTSSFKSLFLFTEASHAWALVAAIIASALAAGFKTALSVVLGEIFDIIGYYGAGTRNGDETLAGMGRWSLILIGLGIGNLISNSAFLALWVVFGELQANSVRHGIFNSLLAKDMTWFDSQEEGISSLLVRIQTQTRDLQNSTSQVFGLLICDVLTALASFAIGLYYSWKLTLVLLATLPVSIIILSLATRKLEPAIQAQRLDLATASKHVTASLTAIDLVKIFNGYKHESRQYQDAIQRAAKHYLVQAACNSIQIGYVAFWVIALFVVGFWYGVVLVEQGLSPGTVLTTFYATLGCIQGLEALLPHWLVIAKGMSAGAFLHSVTDRSKTSDGVERSRKLIHPLRCQGEIRLSNVSFAYPSNPEQNVLNKSSFFFPAGEMVFIVGRSGSGKSTVGNLLARFYEPSTGKIRVDGVSTEALDSSWMRENITLIQQSSVLFDETLFTNVSLGHSQPDSVSRQDVILACQAAFLESTVASLPEGLYTNVGADGHNLSGGQKQRVALARARLRNPQVLILDEITSGLDQVNRDLVMASLRQWRRGKTTIIITHDVHQIDDGEYVYVMDNSCVVQEGFKRDLSTQQGHFAALTAPEIEPVPEIRVITPTIHSPDTPILNTGTTRMADIFLEELENNSRRHSRNTERLSVGYGTTYAIQLRSDHAWDQPRLAPSRAPSFKTSNGELWDSEKRRFSRFLTEKFSLNSPGPRMSRYSSQQFDGLPFSQFTRLSDHEMSSDISDEFSRRNSTCRRDYSSQPASKASEPGGPSIDPDIPMEDLESPRNSPYWPGNKDYHSDDLPTEDVTSSVSEPTDEFSKENKSREELRREDGEVGIAEQAKHKKARKKDSLFTTLKSVWPNLDTQQRFTLLFGIVACTIGAVSTPVFSYCFAQLLGVLTEPGNKSERGLKWVLIMLGVAITDGLGYGGGRYLLEKTGQTWVNALRAEALRRILAQPKPWFSKAKNSPGRVAECLDRNAEEMRNIVGKLVPIIVAVITMIGVSIVWSLVVSWKLTLVSLAPLPIVAGAIKGYTIVSGIWESKCNKGAEDTSAKLTEIFLNIRVVRALALEGYFSKKYLDLVATTLGSGFRRGGFTCSLYGLYQSLGYGLTALVFYYGTVLLVATRELRVAEVMVVVNLLLFSIGSASSFLSSIPVMTMAQATASQMLGYTRLSMEPPEGQRGTLNIDDPLPVQMDELSFSYNGSNQRALQGTSLKVQAGQCTAIVGHSGCGKSTIISLVMGLYTPDLSTEPTLTYGGEPSTKADLNVLRSSMAYVSQTAFLFPTSIAENITYGLPQDSPFRHSPAIIKAAEAAGIQEWITSLSQGYNTIVGEGGQALSGGQAQRISIARALVRRPKLLVLDEPTSALDTESAETVRRAISGLALSGDMAIVLVTHSREMMRVADWIVMLGEGGIKLEEGTYADLLEAMGPFRALIGGPEAFPGKGKRPAV